MEFIPDDFQFQAKIVPVVTIEHIKQKLTSVAAVLALSRLVLVVMTPATRISASTVAVNRVPFRQKVLSVFVTLVGQVSIVQISRATI